MVLKHSEYAFKKKKKVARIVIDFYVCAFMSVQTY